MSSHKSTKKGAAAVAPVPDHESLVRFAELLKLRTLAKSTHDEYLRYLRKVAARAGCDPAQLDEPQVREHLVFLKIEKKYSPSSMRTAVAALRCYYGLHLGRDCRFDFAQGPEPVEGEAVRSGALAFGPDAAGGPHPRRSGAALRGHPRGTLSGGSAADLRLWAASRRSGGSNGVWPFVVRNGC